MLLSTIIEDFGRLINISFDNLGIAPNGIDNIKISASFDIESISLASAPISSANFSTDDLPLELATLTL